MAITLGADVGSTTCKLIAVNHANNEIIWQKYARHNTKQAETLLELLDELREAHPEADAHKCKIFITGSGAAPLVEHLGARFVQEVNAVTMAVEHLHPKAGSVVELGGQDAKVIIFKENPVNGRKNVTMAMNDKCASGTGGTIDKCFIKAGVTEEEATKVKFNPEKLHHVAAKCGVFAETDIVNLIKSSVPREEILNSLADAIVAQNLSVLTKGNTLMPEVVLLGGPNTYLPFLQECWRHRIPEIWDERNVNIPKDKSLEELIIVPKRAEYYAAFGAVLYGINLIDDGLRYAGTTRLKNFIQRGREENLKEVAIKPLVESFDELAAFRKAYQQPQFEQATFSAGQVVSGFLGMDGGSTSSKCVLVDKQQNILLKEYVLSKGNPIEDMKTMLQAMRKYVESFGARLNILGFGATGYAAPVLEESLKSDVNIIETIAHMKSAVAYFGDIDVICDIGGQDIKVLFLKNGELRNFRLSNQCSAGNGMLLQAMASQFGVDVRDFADHAFNATLSPSFNYGCAVFLDSDRVNFQKEGFSKEELMSGLAQVLPKNIWQYVVQIPRLAELGKKYVLQGGTQYNQAALKAQVDYIKARVPDAEVYLHPHSGEAGAIGAAIEARDVVARRGYSTFVGLENAIDISYTTSNNEETRCHFCPNECSRTFIDTQTPSGGTARYIAGFSCDKGTVEDDAALRLMQQQMKVVMKENPNMVSYEARRVFSRFKKPEALPSSDTIIDAIKVKKTWYGSYKRKALKRAFERSSVEDIAFRQSLRIGMPKVLNMWTSGQFFRHYFETLNLKSSHIVFSDDTTEKMSKEGIKYGSIDPCFPAKVAQAHMHNLLFVKHKEARPLNYIYYPAITHMPSFLNKIVAKTSCPVVQGTPNVMKTSFTKETNYFEQRDIHYIDDAVSFDEPNYLKKQMFETWGERLRMTKDESDFAVDQALATWRSFEKSLQQKGKEIIEQVEKDRRMAILMIGRPYHSDPGLSHQITDEFQALGYPILSIRSIPKDPKWLAKYFANDLKRDDVDSPLEITDVWPENFSVNSAEKVWAAKFAARHPNIAVLDLSSFKCGHDAPTYGIIDGIINTAGTPYSALHDLDQTKPSGSIKIRIKTYAYNLEQRIQALQDQGLVRAHKRPKLIASDLLGEIRASEIANDTIEQVEPVRIISSVESPVKIFEIKKVV